MPVAAIGRRRAVDVAELRIAGAAMLAIGAIRPLVAGLPGLPCPLRALTGVPCPLCGMTTSVTDTIHFHLGQAFAANPAGILAVAWAVALLGFRRLSRVDVPAWAPFVALGLMWLFELARYSFI